MKSLPRLPSEDTSDDIDDSSSSVPTTPTTPRPRASSMLRSDSILSAFASQISHGYRGHKEESTPTAESSGMHYRESLIAISSAADSDTDPAEKVSALRMGFQQVEQGLYAQLAKARLEELNIVRRAFLLAGETVRNALIAAHPRSKDTLKSRGEVPELPFESQLQERQPDWWAKRCHVVPKGNIIIREDDWGSIIAFTMRYVDQSDTYYSYLIRFAVPQNIILNWRTWTIVDRWRTHLPTTPRLHLCLRHLVSCHCFGQQPAALSRAIVNSLRTNLMVWMGSLEL